MNAVEQNRMSRGQTSSNTEPTTIRDLYEILRLPVLLAAIAIAGTWAIWYFTHTSCTEELARATGCNPSAIARYISLDALNKIVTHAVIAGGGGGVWSYAMTTRQRKAIEALEHQLAEERERAAEERERAAEERERAAEERERAAGERERFAEERERFAGERERFAGERERAAVEREQLLATIGNLTERLTEQQNGGNGQDHP